MVAESITGGVIQTGDNSVATGGGAYVGGDVDVKQGDFIGRDASLSERRHRFKPRHGDGIKGHRRRGQAGETRPGPHGLSQAAAQPLPGAAHGGHRRRGRHA